MIAISDENKSVLKRYGKLKVEAKFINEQIEDIKPIVRDVLISVNAEDNPVVMEDGKLSLRPRRNWTYSPELEARMAEVKAAQKYEEATGKATFDISYDVYFK